MNEAIHQITFAALFDRIRESSVDMAEITAKLNEKPYRVVDTGIHAKILADWNRKGLLMVKPEANKMHRFSLTEFVWVKFIEKMREYNFPLKAIQNFKNSLLDDEVSSLDDAWDESVMFEAILKLEEGKNPERIKAYLKTPEAKENTKMFMPDAVQQGNLLEAIIVMSLYLKTPISFFIDDEGHGILFNPIMLQDGLYDNKDIERLFSSSFVSISLTEVLAKVLSLSDIDFLYGQLMVISDQEANVLQAMREDDLDSVVVRYDKNHQMDLMEITKIEMPDREIRLLELLLKDGYQDITIKTQQGKVVHCKNTRKVKLK